MTAIKTVIVTVTAIAITTVTTGSDATISAKKSARANRPRDFKARDLRLANRRINSVAWTLAQASHLALSAAVLR
jgi:hypothetical protein